jgi:RNA polymerase sigma-70 factor (ECF subfamily)
MLVTEGSRTVFSWESALASTEGSYATERVMRLADGELDRAYRLAGLILGNQTDAQDATQDALLRAWRAAASLKDPTGFQPWFDRILVNVCRDYLKRRDKVRFVMMDDAVSTGASGDPFARVLDRDEATRAMASLDDDHRIVIVLHYWADLTLEGVAERVGWPVGTVKSRLNRALVTMRDRLDPAGAVEHDR